MAAIKIMNDAPIINLDKVLQKVKKNRVHRVGIELEGGWKKLPDGVTLQHDGSVRIDPRRATRPPSQEELNIYGPGYIPYEPIQVGEIASEPLEVEKYPLWMKKYYPQEVNGTCGLHVHMSFKSALHYQRLMTPSYPSTIMAYTFKWAEGERLGKDHPIWKRLRGESTYCQNQFFAEAQTQARSKSYSRDGGAHRYTVVNFCWGQHGTLECRLLPMMDDVETGIRAVQNVLDITNAFLLLGGEKEESFKIGIEDEKEISHKRLIV